MTKKEEGYNYGVHCSHLKFYKSRVIIEDLLCSRMGTFGSRNGEEVATKWEPKNSIKDNLTERS